MRFLSLFYILLVCSIAQAQDFTYQALLLDKNLTKNANAVVRLDEMNIHISSKKHLGYTVKQVVTVLNKLGDKYARTIVFYDKEKKIKKLEAYVYDTMGKEIDHIKKKDFQDMSAADGFSLYRDDRLLKYRYTPTQYPYTMEFTYEVETSDTGVFPPWYFLSGYLVSVEKSRYTITYDNDALKPIIKEYNVNKEEIFKTEKPGSIVYKADNLQALKSEKMSPGFKSIAPRLSVRLQNFHYKGYDAKVDNWSDMGAWINNRLLIGRTALPEVTKAKVKSLVQDLTDDLEKAKTIYKYVQDNTRYISVQIGIGGFQPISAIDVDRVKYGDCKGLSNYTKALLEAVDVTSYYTVVQAGNDKVDFEEDFADLYQGNHVILAIPYKDRYYWIDCTSQTHPFGFVGDFTDDRKVLVVKRDGGEIVKTVSYLNEENYQKTMAEYALAEDGSISGSAKINTGGIQYDNRFYLEKKTHKEVIKHYKDYWDNINNLTIETYEFENNREDVVFEENVVISAKNYTSISGDRILFSPNAFNRNNYIPHRYRSRKQPFEIQRGFLDEDEFTIHLPNGYKIEAMAEEKIAETEFGTFKVHLTYDKESNTIKYTRSLLIKKGLFSKEKYNLYRDFRRQVANTDGAQIVLIKTN